VEGQTPEQKVGCEGFDIGEGALRSVSKGIDGPASTWDLRSEHSGRKWRFSNAK